MKQNLVFNIQKFSIHDGKGIRSTVFMKGCPLSCLWCHNPEGVAFNKQLLFYKTRCINCGICFKKCKQGAITKEEEKTTININFGSCNNCGDCANTCPTIALEMCGEYYSPLQLFEEIVKDEIFYENSNGGVTFSGGEVMAQELTYLLEVFKKLRKRGININIDTSGYTSWNHLEAVAPYIDTFLYDLKIIDRQKHQNFVGVDNTLIVDNLKKLDKYGSKINLRIPLIKGFNANDKDMDEILNFAKELKNIVAINLLPFHKMGTEKSEYFGFHNSESSFGTPSDDFINRCIAKWNKAGFENIKKGG